MLHGERGSLGIVLEVVQCVDIAIPVEILQRGLAEQQTPQQQQEQQEQQQQQQQQQGGSGGLGAANAFPSRLQGIYARALGPPFLSLCPPLLQQLQQFNQGLPVLKEGRLGCVIDGKADYLIHLDSNHEFVLEDGSATV